jgi:hypothetical protein
MTEFDIAGLDAQRMPDAPPAFLIGAVLWLRRFFIKLADLVVPPDAVLFEHCTGIGHTQIFGALARLGVADILTASPLTAAELAKLTGTHPDALHRVMRAAVTFGFFQLGRDGKYANNRLSRALISGRASRSKEFALYFSSQSNVRSYLEMDYILRTGQEGFMHAQGKDLWEWFDAHPDERETFAQMMMGVTLGEAPMVAKLYPFNEVRRVSAAAAARSSRSSRFVIRICNVCYSIAPA